MNVGMIDEPLDFKAPEENSWRYIERPINGTDARRRLEDKIEEVRLMRETQEFDFEF